ncbi:hypothetical protein K469DRAFT_106370 [Zopfia rhizophila CBS 207.26]|uniref:Uncharacterized protein n=1 Tax=Zopfia rhizophila CBS 207.26 TaxID=1314779 RepID=A0A6A6E729_9PEZI|nr:hypothetical protein K469DRAFT_106370 [Zopfia rhizophila CBS 207.26]
MPPIGIPLVFQRFCLPGACWSLLVPGPESWHLSSQSTQLTLVCRPAAPQLFQIFCSPCNLPFLSKFASSLLFCVTFGITAASLSVRGPVVRSLRHRLESLTLFDRLLFDLLSFAFIRHLLLASQKELDSKNRSTSLLVDQLHQYHHSWTRLFQQHSKLVVSHVAARLNTVLHNNGRTRIQGNLAKSNVIHFRSASTALRHTSLPYRPLLSGVLVLPLQSSC